VVMSRDQNTGHNYSIKVYNKSFERMEQFKYLGTIITDQNSTQEESKSRVQSGNACYHSVHSPLSYSLLRKNIKIKIYKPVALCGSETWSLTLRRGT